MKRVMVALGLMSIAVAGVAAQQKAAPAAKSVRPGQDGVGRSRICRAPTPTRTKTASRSSGPTSSTARRAEELDDSELADIIKREAGPRGGVGGHDGGIGGRRHRRRSGSLVRALRREEQPRLAGGRSAGRTHSGPDPGVRSSGRPRACGAQRTRSPPTRTTTAVSTTAASRAAWSVRCCRSSTAIRSRSCRRRDTSRFATR